MPDVDALAQAVRFAPQLHFHDQEHHFPAGPGEFRGKSRFRESRTLTSDRGWERGVGWRDSDDHDARFYDIAWPVIAGQSLGRYDDPGPYQPDPDDTLRPRASLFSGAKGLFLERRDASAHDKSGHVPVGSAIAAPLFIDVAHLASHDPPLVRLLYWFFYELNWWRIVYTHQGDWEHVTWIWEADTFQNGGRPRWAYFAQHNAGKAIDFDDLQFADAAQEHPKAFVDRNGHPTADQVSNPSRYSTVWETWKHPVQWVARAEWRDFAGAWGGVGVHPDTTGPLGPRFKRYGDHVRVVRRNGELFAKFSG